MGIFDFFKKKKTETYTQLQENLQQENHLDEEQEEIPSEEISGIKENIINQPETKIIKADFQEFKKYSEYVISAITLQYQNSFAPISAYEDLDGAIKGFLYIISGKTGRYSFSPDEAVFKMKERFEGLLNEKKIKSYIIGYHSQFNNDDNYALATEGNFRAITFYCNFGKGLINMINLPYDYNDGKLGYSPIPELSEEESDAVLRTQMEQGKQYYSEREEIKPPSTVNEYGIEIERANDGRLGDLWAGVLGFERLSQADEYFIPQLIAAIYVSGEIKVSSEVEVKDSEDDFIDLRSIEEKRKEVRSAFPVIKTNKSIDVNIRTVSEWEHMDNIEAIIYGSGKDTFGITFFATDYSYNKEKYKTSKNLNIQLSGILLHVEEHKVDSDSEDFTMAENFTGYFPNQEVNYLGGFDFIGIVKNIRQVSISNVILIEGFMLEVQLITHPDDDDYFVVEMFLNKENTELSIEKGMKITGLFLLQGRIA
jgi:hypothetical protein